MIERRSRDEPCSKGLGMTTSQVAATGRAAAAGGYPRRWLGAIVMIVGALMDTIDVTIVNVALPAIRRALHPRATHLVRGAAGAAMAPQVLATFRAVFAGAERGKAFSIYGAMLGFASAVGLLLGGVLTEANLFGWSWRAVFFVNIPVAAAALIAGLRFVPETRDPGARRPDVTGAALLAASLVAIVYPLLEGRQLGGPAWVWVLLGAGVAGLGLLGLLEARRTGRAAGPAPL